MKITIKTLIVAAFCLSMSPLVTAQSATDINRVKAYYFAAEDALDSGQYDDAIEALNKAISLRGDTDARALSIRIKSLMGKQDYVAAKHALDKFYAANPNDDLQREMAPVLLDIDRKVEEQNRLLRAAAIAEQQKLTEERARIDAIKKRRLKAENDKQVARLGTQGFLACETGEACYKLGSLTLGRAHDSDLIEEDYDKKADIMIRSLSRDEKTALSHKLLVRGCELGSVASCRTIVTHFKAPGRRGKLSKLCSDGDGQSCYVKAYGLSGAKYLQQINYVEKGCPKCRPGVVHIELGDTAGWRIFNPDSLLETKYGNEFIKKEHRKALSKQALPFFWEACHHGVAKACSFFLIKRNKNITNKKMRRKAKDRMCEINPNAHTSRFVPYC